MHSPKQHPTRSLTCLSSQVLAAFGAAAWRPLLLRLVYAGGSIPTGLASLPLVAGRLLHLELSAPALQHLEGIAAACPQLRCLSLRGCCQLGDASLAGLAGCTSLRALDLGGLAVLTDAAVFHIAKLPQLAALNLSGTGVGDATLQLLIFGHKVRGWQAAAGAAQLPPEAAAWPPLPLEHLQLAGTRAGAEGAAELAHLPQLRCGAAQGGSGSTCWLRWRPGMPGRLLARHGDAGNEDAPLPLLTVQLGGSGGLKELLTVCLSLPPAGFWTCVAPALRVPRLPPWSAALRCSLCRERC